MEADEQAKLVLAFAKVLYVNGQATEQTVSAAERLARARGLHAALVPHWSELQLVANDRHGTLIAQAAAYPAGVEMNRVASTMRAIEDVVSGRLGPDVAVKAIDDIARSSPAPTWLFVLAAAAGAVALAVIFGVKHFSAAILIFVSAGAGAILRRALGQLVQISSYNRLARRFSLVLSARWRFAATIATTISPAYIKLAVPSAIRPLIRSSALLRKCGPGTRTMHGQTATRRNEDLAALALAVR